MSIIQIHTCTCGPGRYGCGKYMSSSRWGPTKASLRAIEFLPVSEAGIGHISAVRRLPPAALDLVFGSTRPDQAATGWAVSSAPPPPRTIRSYFHPVPNLPRRLRVFHGRFYYITQCHSKFYSIAKKSWRNRAPNRGYPIRNVDIFLDARSRAQEYM